MKLPDALYDNMRMRSQFMLILIINSILSVLLVALMLAFNFYSTTMDHALSEQSKQNLLISAGINETLELLDKNTNYLLSNRHVFNSMQDDDFGLSPESFEEVKHMKDILFSIISTTKGIHSAVYFSANGARISSLSGVVYNDFLRQETFLNHPIVQEVYAEPRNAYWYTDEVPLSGYVYYLRGIRTPNGGDVLGIICFVLGTEIFGDQIHGFSDKEHRIYLYNEQGEAFVISDDSAPLAPEIYASLKTDSGQVSLDSGDRLFLGSSSRNGWMIINEVEKSGLIDTVEIILIATFSAIVCILLSIIFAFLFSRIYTRDLSALVDVMEKVEKEGLKRISLQGSNFESRTLISSYNSMIGDIETLNKNLYAEIEKKLQAEKETAYIQALWDNMFENSDEGIVITDGKGRVERVNKRFSVITGYSFDEVKGKSTSILKSEKHSGDFYRNMWESLIETGKWSGEIWNRRKSGEAYPEWLGISSFREQHRGELKYFAVFHDISDKKDQEERLQWMTNYDALTGLPKRSLFTSKIRSELNAAERNLEICALLIMNIDGLQKVNHNYGARMGDLVLEEISRRLKITIRDENSISRFGGDEFAILVPRLKDREKVLTVIKRVQKTLHEPISNGLDSVELTASFGIALSPQDADNDHDLITKATLALNRTKSKRRGSYSLFDSDLDEEIMGNAEIEMNLRKALNLGEFEVHYQPKVNAVDHNVVGFEALLRWKQNGREWIPPSRFIPIAEEAGIIVDIGYLVIREACRFLLELQKKGYSRIIVGINISARQFAESDFIENLISIVDSHGIPHESMDLEITESITASDAYNTIESLAKLSEAGFSISIDDFGTGYSSLKYLISLPFDTIKVDKSFIDTIQQGEGRDTILNSILSLAQSIGKNLVAEGVETEIQEAYLVKKGCPVVQGYLHSRPVTADEALSFIESMNRTIERN